jgi:hypothetical protein
MLRPRLLNARFWRQLFRTDPPLDGAGDANLFALGRRLRRSHHVFHEVKSLRAGAHRDRRANPNELSWADESGRHLRARR